MKIKLFTPETTGHVRKTGNKISFSRKSGVITLSRELLETIEATNDEKVILAQDETKPKDWYILRSLQAGFVLRRKKSSGCFNSTASANSVLKSCDIKENSASFLVASEPTVIDKENYFAIITSKPYVRSR